MAELDFTDTLPEGRTLKDIQHRESRGQNLPPEANYAYPRSHASGLEQIQPGTWRGWTKEFGVGQQYNEAYQAPPAIQTLVSALALRKYGANSPYTWAASGPYRPQVRGATQQKQANLLDFSDTMPAGKKAPQSPEANGGLIDFGDTMPAHRTVEGQAGQAPWRVPPAQEGPRVNAQRPPPPMDLSYGPQMPPRQPTATPQEQLRRNLGLQSPEENRAARFADDPSIAARIKQLPPQTLAAYMRDPNNPMWERILGGLGGVAADFVDPLLHLPELARRTGQETAANIATPETAGDVANVAMATGATAGNLVERGARPPVKPGEAPPAEPPPAAAPPPGAEAPVPPGVPHPPPPYEPIPGGTAHPAEEATPVAEPPPVVHGGPSSPAPEVGPEVPPADKPAVPPKTVFTKLERVQGYLNDLADKFGLPRLPVEAIKSDTKGGGLAVGHSVEHQPEVDAFGKEGIYIPREYVSPLRFIINLAFKLPFRAYAAAHEFGHYLQYTKLLEADQATRDGIVAAWKRESAAGIERGSVHAAMAEQQWGDPGSVAEGYEKDFGEWFANQAASWLTTKKPATTLAEKFFKGVATQWRKIYKTVTGRQGTAPEIDAFMRKHWDETVGQSGGKVGGVNPLEPPAETTVPIFGMGRNQAGPPTRPARDWIKRIEDGFQKVRGSATADRAQIKQWVDSLPKEVRDSTLLGRLFAYGEGDRSVNLTPREKQYFDQYVQPMRDENRQLYNKLKNAGLKDDALDPDHMHRAVMGRTREYDPYTGSGSEETPVVGYKSTMPSASRTRQYHVLEDANGQRQVIWEHPRTGSVSSVTAGTHNPIKLDQIPKRGGGTKAPDIKPGETVTMGGKSYTVKNALTREIEANTSTRYYKNALASVIRANTQLKSANRLLDFLRDIKQTPEFQDWAKPNYVREADQLRQDGWRSPNLGGMPIFREFLMHPTLAGAIEDFYGSMAQKGSLVEKLYKVTRFAVQSMFWSPLVHASNAAFHWATARGIDWVNPMGYKRLATTVPRAIYEVVTQGPKYQSLLREGSGLVYGGLAQRDFFEHVLRSVGENVVKQPNKWDPIARVLGVGPTDLVNMIYTGSAKALWAASDMMMVQRVMELEQKGMGTAEAIAEAEKHLPNYRIPTEVLGSRAVAQGLKNVGLTEFSRYHYGMIMSVAHMARDLTVGTMKERLEAMGSIMATGVLMAIVTPYLSKKLQEATGDKKIEYSPKGSTVIPQSVWDIMTHKSSPFDFINRIITINPVVHTAIEAAQNRDMFTGHNIVSPGDLVKHPVRFFGRGADYAAKNLVSPYGTFAEGTKHGLKGLPEQILKQGVGARSKPKLYQSKGEQRYQETHKGPIEKGTHWMYDYLRKLSPSYGGAQ